MINFGKNFAAGAEKSEQTVINSISSLRPIKAAPQISFIVFKFKILYYRLAEYITVSSDICIYISSIDPAN